MTNSEFIKHKAHIYFDRCRDAKTGVPLVSLDKCYQDVLEDYSKEDMSKYLAIKGDSNASMLRGSGTVIWADGTNDRNRECTECGSHLCHYPVHKDSYKTIGFEAEYGE